MAMFGTLKQRLSKTREGLVGKITTLVSTRHKIDEDLLEEIEEILIGADISVNVTFEMIDKLKTAVHQQGYVEPAEIISVLKEIMQQALAASNKDGETAVSWWDHFLSGKDKPRVIMVVGVNGTGKTTTIGKLAHFFVRRKQKVLLAAADTFRAAASQQLEIWSERAKVDIVRNQAGADPGAVAFDALAAAKLRGIDVLIVDTAGRLHNKINLMNEISKIRRVLARGMTDAPHEVLLVLDASTGQNGLQQAKGFTEAVGVTGLVLTKLDGTAKGGIVFSIQDELNLPVRFIGLGERMEDLEEFDAAEFVEALFQ